MPLGLGSALWAYVAPVEKTNLVISPSFEFGTAGCAAIQSAGLGTSSATQQYGAWSLFVTPTSNGTSGAVVGSWVATNLQDYSISAHAKLVNGVSYIFGASDPTGGNIDVLGTINITGGGTWHRYSMSYTELVGGGGRGVILRKASGANTGTYWVDGVQAELGSVTTYFDGDVGGGTWQAGAHNSTSLRPGQYRGGGSVIALADIGLSVDQFPGAGMPPVENSLQSYAIIDGAQFQRTRAASRQFHLTAKPINGTSLGDFHVTRRTIIDAFKPDLVTPQQPIRFLYVGGQGTVQLDAYYDDGLGLGNMDGPIAENAGVSFVATDPYWHAPTQQGTTLGARVSLGSVNYIAKRSPLGKWGTLGQNALGSTIQANVSPSLTAVEDLLINAGGTVIVGGYFGTVAGTIANSLAFYFPTTNTFGTLTGGTVGVPGADVRTIALTPSGTLFFAGVFGSAGGTSMPRIGQHVNGAFGTLTGGTIDNQINKILYSPLGTLFIGGAFSLAGGTIARRLAQHTNGSWGTLNQNTGTIDNSINTLAWGLDNKSLYIGGNFGSAGGTGAIRVAQLVNGSWGTMNSGANGGGTIVYDLTTKLDGRIIASGDFTTLGGGTVNNIGEWNGVQWQAEGLGVQGLVRSALVRRDNSILLAGSFSAAGSVSIPDNVAVWNGASFVPLDLDLPPGADVYAMVEAPDSTLYIGGLWSGTGYAASVGTMVNIGRAQAYPTLRLRNLSTGTARIYQLLNTTTGAGIYFNLTLLASEEALLTLAPGDRSFQSNFRGNVFSAILPGSNLATWSLLSGTNYVSFFSDNDSLEASFFWTPRSWSIDGGTVQ